jgi:predicted transcriptional regulator of viral defense system
MGTIVSIPTYFNALNKNNKSIADFVNDLQQKGRYAFTKAEAKRTLGESDAVLKLSLWRLAKKQRIALIREGFYIIVPLEYASSGVLPPEWFIDDLMKFIRQPYYVGLLSAAAIHGAAHQQPQEFHVVIPEALRSIKVGPLQIRFFKKASMKLSSTETSKTQTGYMKVSDPAVTAMDLVAYASRVGGLDRVLTVLQELSEKITPDLLLQASRRERNVAHVQRLGWLLEKAGRSDLIDGIIDWLKRKEPRETPLDPSLPRKGFARDPKWNVIVNAEVEGEL